MHSDRKYVVGSLRHLAFYKVGLSWVLVCHPPGGGLIHLAHWRWWRPFALFPRALIGHYRVWLRHRTGADTWPQTMD